MLSCPDAVVRAIGGAGGVGAVAGANAAAEAGGDGGAAGGGGGGGGGGGAVQLAPLKKYPEPVGEEAELSRAAMGCVPCELGGGGGRVGVWGGGGGGASVAAAAGGGPLEGALAGAHGAGMLMASLMPTEDEALLPLLGGLAMPPTAATRVYGYSAAALMDGGASGSGAAADAAVRQMREQLGQARVFNRELYHMAADATLGMAP